MQLAEIFERYDDKLKTRYGHCLSAEHHAAIWAIRNCRTETLGQIMSRCPKCDKVHFHPHSCGHRSCPKCSHHTTSEWLFRQQNKLLSVRYYMLTFTLPGELRITAFRNQTDVYSAMFKAVKETLFDIAANPKHLGAIPGFTCVLHTHSRRLDHHPHIHVIMPGGGINVDKNQWITPGRKHLFPKEVLKLLFREKMLAALRQKQIAYEHHLHKIKWVVNIKAAGKGEPAFKYLSKYLYKGVIQERNIVSDKDGIVTFSYEDSETKQRKTRSLPGENFLFLVLKHVLPKGFRRARDFGFLHGNAKKTLFNIQLILKTVPSIWVHPVRSMPKCTVCDCKLVIIACKVFPKENFQKRGSP